MQKENGSIKDSILETSVASLIYKHSGCCRENLNSARKWLTKEKDIPMTPFLFYWFEEKDEKTFFDCWDKGEITKAFRSLALKK